MVPLTPSKRARIVERYLASRDFEHPLTMAEVGKHFDIPSSTVSDTLKRWREHGTAYALDRPGRTHKLDDRDERRLIRDVVKYTRRKWGDFGKDYNISKRTVRRIPASYGYHKQIARRKPFITLAAKKKRRLWAASNFGTRWRRIILTDETSIELGEEIGCQ
jgi:transposase